MLGSHPFPLKLNVPNIPVERQYCSSCLNSFTFVNSMKFTRFPILSHDSPAYDKSESTWFLNKTIRSYFSSDRSTDIRGDLGKFPKIELVIFWCGNEMPKEYDFNSHCLYYFKRYVQQNCNAESLCVLQLFWKIFLTMFFFSQQIISISTKLWKYKYTKIFHKHRFNNFAKVLNFQGEIFPGD